MKIALVSSLEPFVDGGYRNIVAWLEGPLKAAGHQVEIVWLPFADETDPLEQMWAYRLMDLERSCDRIICFRPPAHLVPHPKKVVWFIHHLRIFYDLWGTPYSPLPDAPATRAMRDAVRRMDDAGLREAGALFANSRVVAERLERFNGLTAKVLFPPVHAPERFRADAYGEEIVSVCRIEHHKRQHLMVEAMARARSGVRLRLCGRAQDEGYLTQLRAAAGRAADRVTIEARWIGEEEKVERLAGALAHVYAPFDEDSYGYPTIEAAHAARATVTTQDAGGVPEFVIDGVNGLIVAPTPEALAGAFDALYEDRARAKRLGEAARARVSELGIDWPSVVAALTAPLPGEAP
jgi:glycosyltransferase involved in cell wall biosynthesis